MIEKNTDKMVLEYATELFASADIKKSVKRVLAKLCEYADASSAGIYKYSGEHGIYTILHSVGNDSKLKPEMKIGGDLKDVFLEMFNENQIGIYKDNILVPLSYDNTKFGFIIFGGCSINENIMSEAKDGFDSAVKLAPFIAEAAIHCELEISQTMRMNIDTFTGCCNEYKYQVDMENLEVSHMDSLGVLITDIYSLKNLNNTYGKSYGNKLIKKIGSVLKQKFSDKCVYRTAGDEFTVVCKNMSYFDFATRAKEIEEYFYKKDQNVSIGYMWEFENINFDVVVKQANDMLEVNRRNIMEENDNQDDMPSHVKELLMAIKNDQFRIFLQPQTDMNTAKIVGCEGLARYLHPERGYIDPNSFVPILEANYLIKYLDIYIFEQACIILRKWIDEGRTIVPISVNFSKVTLLYSELIDKLRMIREKYRVPSYMIEIEITESIGELSRQLVFKVQEEFMEEGYRIALDDFGSGYTNMSLLIDILPNRLKLDKSMIDRVSSDDCNKIIVRHIIDMAHEIGTVVVAEGIEKLDQRDTLLGLGCDQSQGFFDGHPMKIEEFEQEYMTAV